MASPPSPADAALGCLLGAAVGDAAGAVLEFQDAVSAEDVAVAMAMPGGGCWSVGPGQFTDDTELALSLAHGLTGQDPHQGFPAQAVAEQYSAWLASRPFDRGITCTRAFSAGPDAEAMEAAAQHSVDSKANGALMRATPLAIWAHRQDDDAIAEAAAADARLSHANPTCQDCNAAYCIALARLIRCPGDSAGAIARAEAWAQQHAAGDEVRQWLEDSKDADSPCLVDARELAGFVRHAFTQAFYHLRQRSTYAEGIRATLATGGDTDTNACIVGGALGALWGSAGIPAHMAQPVLQYKHPEPGRWPGHARPERLQGARIPELAAALVRAGE